MAHERLALLFPCSRTFFNDGAANSLGSYLRQKRAIVKRASCCETGHYSACMNKMEHNGRPHRQISLSLY
jgi:hypothetical protein